MAQPVGRAQRRWAIRACMRWKIRRPDALYVEPGVSNASSTSDRQTGDISASQPTDTDRRHRYADAPLRFMERRSALALSSRAPRGRGVATPSRDRLSEPDVFSKSIRSSHRYPESRRPAASGLMFEPSDVGHAAPKTFISIPRPKHRDVRRRGQYQPCNQRAGCSAMTADRAA